MLTVIGCLSHEHDWRLVAMAAVVCLAGCLTALRLYGRARAASVAGRWVWLVLAGVVAGAGVWATHFIAMLAFQPPFRTGYLPMGTVGSLLIAILACAAGFVAASRPTHRLRGALMGGPILGAGVGLMHFCGMMAFRTEGKVQFDGLYVAASLVFGCVFAVAALLATGRTQSLARQATGAALLTLSITGLHFIAMAAVTILPDPGIAVPAKILSNDFLAGLVCAQVALIVLAAFGAVIIDALTRRFALEQLGQALDAIGEGVAFFDHDDRLVLWNRKYVELAGEARDLARKGTPFIDFLARGLEGGYYLDAVGREEAWLADRLAARRSRSCVLEQPTADGRWFRVEERPSGAGVVSVLVDVTDLKRDAEALEKARDDADAANRAKSLFLTAMSHELRTPLNGVMGIAAALAATPLRPDQVEMVDLIRNAGGLLERLVRELLDLARIERRTFTVEPRLFHLGDMMRSAERLLMDTAVRKGLAIEVVIPPEGEVMVMGDELRICQTLSILAANAFKFTDQGKITLRVAAAGEGRFAFEMIDTGVGFDAAKKARLFSGFEPSDPSSTGRQEGFGLGLALARELARVLGGELDCESAPGAGSTFRLELPLAVQTITEPAARDDARPAEARSETLRVLVVDDNPLNRKVIALMLEAAAVVLSCAENGLEACEQIEREQFDLVLMDVQMPVMDGLTAVRRIRAVEASRGADRLPIVMVTANALPEHFEASRAAGADDHLTKPINPAALFETLDAIWEQRESRAAA